MTASDLRSYSLASDMPGGSDGVGRCPSQIGRTGTVRDIVPMSVSHIVPINSLWWDSVPSKFLPVPDVPDKSDCPRSCDNYIFDLITDFFFNKKFSNLQCM